MVAELQLLPISGALVLTDSNNNATVGLTLLCGISNGSVVVPIKVKSDGSLVTSGA